jgi:peptide/nickel transport system ATP-binding protein
VQELKTHFPVRGGGGRVVRAVDGVSFDVPAGRIVGLVGESGSGKTTIGRTILRLVEPTAGRVLFEGTDLLALDESAMRPFRRRLQIVFQDPYASLNPRMTVAEIIGEALGTHGLAPGRARRPRIAEILDRVGLDPSHMDRYPNAFSGGQRQRIGIARAIAVEPRFIVADEAVSALDVSVQAQILNLLLDLRADLGLTMLFIAHDLAVVEYLCDEVVVLYLGRVMERAPRDRLYTAPAHPYTRALLSAVPVPDPDAPRNRMLLQGDIPSPIDPPSGCVFRTRCPFALPACAETIPPLATIAPGHQKACIRDDIA